MALTHSRTRFTSSLPLSIPKAGVNAFLSPNYEALLLAETGQECQEMEGRMVLWSWRPF